MNERIEAKPRHLLSETDKNRIDFEQQRQEVIAAFAKTRFSKLFSNTDLVYKECTLLEKPVRDGIEVTIHLTVIRH